MGNKLSKWSFLQHPGKPALKEMDVIYWRSVLNKILKVGTELEFNLPEPKGSCKGEVYGCGCRNLNNTNTCWTKCILEGYCKAQERFDNCKTKAELCVRENCAGCTNWTFNCPSIGCSHFMPICLTCTSFKTNCNNCSLKVDPTKDPANIRHVLQITFKPNNCYGTISNSGVHDVRTDGSLLGDKGVEIVTTGRRVDYWEFYKMFKNIIDTSIANGAYVNERCSVHMHLLTTYYDNTVESQNNSAVPSQINELEKPMPEIILTNFHQLIRKYQNALTWLSMGLDVPETLTRWEKYRVSILDISPIMNSMHQIKDQVFKKSGNTKYGFVNYKFMGFSNTGDVTRFHLEMRNLDAILCPSILASFVCLYHALAIKAVEISHYGILEMESPEWFEQAKKMKNAILNNIGEWKVPRFSDTSKIPLYVNQFKEEAHDMLYQLKHILIQTGPAYKILETVAEKPVSYQRLEGKSWKDIEDSVAVSMQTDESELTKLLTEIIDLRLVSRCKSMEEWMAQAATFIKEEGILTIPTEAIHEDVKRHIKQKSEDGMVIWSESMGAVLIK